MAARLEELGEKDVLNAIMKTDGSQSDLGISGNYNGSQRDASDLRTNRNDSRVTRNNDSRVADNNKNQKRKTSTQKVNGSGKQSSRHRDTDYDDEEDFDGGIGGLN